MFAYSTGAFQPPLGGAIEAVAFLNNSADHSGDRFADLTSAVDLRLIGFQGRPPDLANGFPDRPIQRAVADRGGRGRN